MYTWFWIYKPERLGGWGGLRTPPAWHGRAQTRRQRPRPLGTFWGPLRGSGCGRRTAGGGGGPACRGWPEKNETRERVGTQDQSKTRLLAVDDPPVGSAGQEGAAVRLGA